VTIALEDILERAALRFLGLLPKLFLVRVAHPSVVGRGHDTFVGGESKTLKPLRP
jgi:hypothetical protein